MLVNGKVKKQASSKAMVGTWFSMILISVQKSNTFSLRFLTASVPQSGKGPSVS